MTDVIQTFVDLGAEVMLPIIIFIFALVFRVKPGRAIKSALMVGIGFIGLTLVTDLLGDAVGAASQEMVERFDLALTNIDVGWPAAAAISYGTILGISAIPIGIAVNIVLLIFKLTSTLNVDIWNFWQVAFIGNLSYALTGDFKIAVYSMIVYQVLLYLLADIIAPYIKKYYGFPNITFPHGTSVPGFAVALVLNWVFDRVPGLNRIKIDANTIQKRFGVLGEPPIMGAILGIIIGLIAGYSVGDILMLSVQTAAVLVLLPRMVSLLMEGLTPISEAAGDFVKKRFPGREVNIGMNSALALGDPGVLSSSLILIPITLLLAFILPGNSTLPFGDYGNIPYLIALMVPVFGGDILRGVIGGALYLVPILYISSWSAPLITEVAQTAGFNFGNASSITALGHGGLWTTLLFVLSSEYLPWVTLTVLLVIFLVCGFFVNRKKAA